MILKKRFGGDHPRDKVFIYETNIDQNKEVDIRLQDACSECNAMSSARFSVPSTKPPLSTFSRNLGRNILISDAALPMKQRSLRMLRSPCTPAGLSCPRHLPRWLRLQGTMAFRRSVISRGISATIPSTTSFDARGGLTRLTTAVIDNASNFIELFFFYCYIKMY
nr:uncharacterized protein LOC115269534 [Aedes albopictus]